jgi:hypothetical protein
MRCKAKSVDTFISVLIKHAANKSNESEPNNETRRIKIRITFYKEGFREDELSFGVSRLVIGHKLSDVSGQLTVFIRAMIGAVSTSETSVSFYQTTLRNMPEDNSSLYSPP